MTREWHLRQVFRQIALVALLVSAQAIALGHMDLDGHFQDAPCALCISASTFDGANANSADLVLDVEHLQSTPELSTEYFSSRVARTHPARGPPLIS